MDNNLHNKPTEISSLMRRLEAEAQNKKSNAVVINCVLGATTYYAHTDEEAILEVMGALIDNATKFTERGSITFGYELSDDEIYFNVKDTGIGIPRDVQVEIFEETPDNADTSLIKAMRRVQALGGDMGLESRGSGKGSNFWFTLPNVEAEAPAGAAIQPDSAPAHGTDNATVGPRQASDAPEGNAAAPQPAVHGITILIAEDNESNFLLFRSILESRYNILHAFNGQEAVDLFRTNDVDLILMDINMPLKDGYEATREIRQLSQAVPIVAVTAYAFSADKQRIYQNGFNAYVSKPISINRLERIINDLLSNK